MKRTKKFLLPLLVLVMVTILLPSCQRQGSSSGSGGSSRPRVYRMADNQPDGYPTVLGNLAFAKYVEEKTNGNIKIEVYNNSVLGDERSTIEMTQAGSIHFIRVGINPLSALNPAMNALAMPFLFNDREHMFRVLDGPIGQEVLESLQRQSLLGLSWMDAGFRNFYNSRREIRTPADMQGLKIRVQESALMMEMVRLLGASPTPMAYSETVSLTAQKTTGHRILHGHIMKLPDTTPLICIRLLRK